jgi:hypothetical protein
VSESLATQVEILEFTAAFQGAAINAQPTLTSRAPSAHLSWCWQSAASGRTAQTALATTPQERGAGASTSPRLSETPLNLSRRLLWRLSLPLSVAPGMRVSLRGRRYHNKSCEGLAIPCEMQRWSCPTSWAGYIEGRLAGEFLTCGEGYMSRINPRTKGFYVSTRKADRCGFFALGTSWSVGAPRDTRRCSINARRHGFADALAAWTIPASSVMCSFKRMPASARLTMCLSATLRISSGSRLGHPARGGRSPI